MIIKSAEFVKSSARADQCPPPDFPEYAFIGRSNVGKSSVINMLAGNRKLAKTSSTPGKTRLINHFLINNKWYLVDLPGFGYAKASKTLRKDFSILISKYIENRQTLVCLFMLVDSRHPPPLIRIWHLSGGWERTRCLSCFCLPNAINYHQESWTKTLAFT